ncbi:hypothetical protein D915_006335 [Fasciola hepatica]|uniref:Centriolar satellite-associated tubulin polyglutamylase complex regulator 1 n=1 Tax=Fasciola hepatica TaxID=6192 RepID=A0A4E0RXH5_FASHE|nr:hypothetical protein D915_006335 [Fasciola hepatica]
MRYSYSVILSQKLYAMLFFIFAGCLKMDDLLGGVEYFAQSGVRNYLEDALCGLLTARDKSRAVEPSAYMLNYFWHVKNGTHTTLREYDYISLTPYNRKVTVSRRKRPYYFTEITPNEFFSLAQLLCPDLPKRILTRTVAAFRANPQGEASPTFTDLYRMFQFHVFFEVLEGKSLRSTAETRQNTEPDSQKDGDMSTGYPESYACASVQTDFCEEVVHPDGGLYVNTAQFKCLIPNLFVTALFPLPSKQMVQIHAKGLIKDITMNLDRFLHNLANEPQVAREADILVSRIRRAENVIYVVTKYPIPSGPLIIVCYKHGPVVARALRLRDWSCFE